MNVKTIKMKNTPTDYLNCALYAFGGLGLEILLMMLETNIYGVSSAKWSILQHIIHWAVTCLAWGSISFILIKKLPINKQEIGKHNYFVAFIIFALSIIYTSMVWKGFKPVIEFSNIGLVKFLFQYIYYAFESLLIILIIAHGQKAFEQWFKSTKFLPFGGILLAITWGLIHILTQGASTGLYAFIQSLLYGCIYLALNKNFKVSYIAIALMFIL